MFLFANVLAKETLVANITTAITRASGTMLPISLKDGADGTRNLHWKKLKKTNNAGQFSSTVKAEVQLSSTDGPLVFILTL